MFDIVDYDCIANFGDTHVARAEVTCPTGGHDVPSTCKRYLHVLHSNSDRPLQLLDWQGGSKRAHPKPQHEARCLPMQEFAMLLSLRPQWILLHSASAVHSTQDLMFCFTGLDDFDSAATAI